MSRPEEPTGSRDQPPLMLPEQTREIYRSWVEHGLALAEVRLARLARERDRLDLRLGPESPETLRALRRLEGERTRVEALRGRADALPRGER